MNAILKHIYKTIIENKSSRNTFMVLLFILTVGVFLRTYNFREWLYFYPDQARDLMIVRDYLTGKIPLPLMGFIAASTKFQLGAMYYYFQIISAKIFGVAPQTVAYPDLFFNILAIPLLFYFLRRFFKKDISLVLTGFYAVSYYAIEFSRFAWNPNPMPFFVLLFLLSLWKLICVKENTSWKWLSALGISIGIGIQLHTILLYLFPIVSFFVFLRLLKDNWHIWKKLVLVALIVLSFNTNQIVREVGHNFSNTRTLFKLSTRTVDTSDSNRKMQDLALDVVCHAQANSHIITSLGEKTECDFLDIIENNYKKNINKQPVDSASLFGIIASLLFSLAGYGLLIYFYKKEKNSEKKSFLGLILLYAGFSFLIIFPVIGDAPLRYYLQLFFVPFLMLGIILEFIREKFPKLFIWVLISAALFIIGANLKTIFAEVSLYVSNNHSQPQYVVLGELENMTNYIQQETASSQTVYMIGDGKYMQNYYKPFLYTFSERNITLLRELKNMDNIPSGEQVFYVGPIGTGQKSQTNGFTISKYKNFGEIGIYILNTER